MNPPADTVNLGHTVLVRVGEDYKCLFRVGDTVAVYPDSSPNQTSFSVGHQYVPFVHWKGSQHFITVCLYFEDLNGHASIKGLLKIIRRESKKRQKRG